MPRGKGRRCHGFLDSTGSYARCARAEMAGGIDAGPDGLYPHRLAGECRCGATHGAADTGQRSRIVDTYDYRSATGELLFQVVRYEPKDFRQRRPDGAGGWIWNMKGVQLVPYRLQEVLAAVAVGDPIWICEGEKDAEALRALDQVATTNPGGALKWRDEYATHFRGAIDVRIVADRDLTGPDRGKGYRHAQQVAASLAGVCENVRVYEAAQGKDVTDHLAAGLALDALIEIDPAERLAKLLAEDAKPAESMFEALHEGAYKMTVPAAGTELSVDFLRRDGAQLKGELLVRCMLAGARTFDGVLSIGDINLSSARTRQSHAKYLEERAQAKDIDWTGMLEEFAQRVLAAERTGAPAVLLSDLPRPAPDEALEVDGLPLLARHPAILFGDGGCGKSYIALHVAGTLAVRGLRVAYFDWELAGEDHRDRLERLFGPSMPGIFYARCARPLVYEAERLRRIVRERAVQFAIFDSVAFACDGPPEAAEVAGRYFQSLRQLGEIGSLHVAHVSKSAEGADQKPFGSVFWHNGARASWNVKLAESSPDDRQITVGLYNRKANLAGLRAAVGFELAFGEQTTCVRRVDLQDVPDLAAGLTVRQRMAAALRRGAMTREALAEEIGAKPDTIKRTVNRYTRQFQVLDGGLVGLAKGES